MKAGVLEELYIGPLLDMLAISKTSYMYILGMVVISK